MLKKRVLGMIIAFLGFLLALSLIPANPFYHVNWVLLSVMILGIAFLVFFVRFESSAVTAKEIALIGTMASLAALFRVPFAAIPGLQPTTFLVMLTGYVFGAQTGFAVGAVAALVSNFFLGQGPWTPWQMFCWGMSGVSAALLAGEEKSFRPVGFTVLACLWGYLFGWMMNIFYWVGFVYPLTWKTFLATYAASFVFDSIHAAGNVIFSLVFGKAFYRILWDFRKKLNHCLS